MNAPPMELGGESPTGRGQARDPIEFGEILRASGINLTDHEMAVRYYRERALPHMIPFPTEKRPESEEPLLEGVEPWDIGMSMDQIDWMETMIASPLVIPGVTTVQRVWGTCEGTAAMRRPLDLDLYVDSSGSMPDPQRRVSFPALAGAVLCLSALRAGSRVQVTLWSGKNQVHSTRGFVRDETEILRVLTGYFGGATSFPLPTLRRTYEGRRKSDPPAHLLVISDDGVSTLFDESDEEGTAGWALAAGALERARGGGTLVLQLPGCVDELEGAAVRSIRKARDAQGWQVHGVRTLEELLEFARVFSRRRFGVEAAAGRDKSSGGRAP